MQFQQRPLLYLMCVSVDVCGLSDLDAVVDCGGPMVCAMRDRRKTSLFCWYGRLNHASYMRVTRTLTKAGIAVGDNTEHPCTI